MIICYFNLKCDTCGTLFLPEPLEELGFEEARSILLAADQAGWKVYRTARDVYYGKAWCRSCIPGQEAPTSPAG